MGSFLVVLFWIWCGISIVVLITRPIYRRVRTTTPASEPMAPVSAFTDLADDAAGAARSVEPTSAARSEPGSDAPRTTPVLPGAAESPATDAPRVTVTDIASPAPGAMPSNSLGRAVRVQSTSVADVLSGIRMPCDLAPLTGAGTGDPSHVVFATEGRPAEEVGERVGDELERIGCELTPLDSTTLRADRGSESVEVRIHPDASAVTDGNAPRFPTAPAGSVVVEFRVR